MNYKIINIFGNVIFIFAIILFFSAISEKFLNVFGWEFIWIPFQPGTILLYTVILVLFFIAILLKQIRDEIENIKK